MRYLSAGLIFLICAGVKAQNNPDSYREKRNYNSGIIIGNVLDAENSKPIPSVTIILNQRSDSAFSKTTISAKDGAFIFEQLPYGHYSLQFSAVGYGSLKLDSIYIRAERFDFDLNEIKLSKKTTQLGEIIIYVEKPLIENKDGKIIFNAGESALSSGATTTELLKQTPLVNVDNDGKIMLRGKDVKVLIDDKPIELNGKQLQDLLESMPGSMIDKIEVMTTPPPQYANERGGVINIVTKKGRVGINGRLNVNYGTRGEAGINASFGYRKNKLALNMNAGYGYNEYQGNSYSNRQNMYIDSINFFNTITASNSNNKRPNARLSLDYEVNKRNNLNFTFLYNANNAGNYSSNEYTNLNRFNVIYKLSDRFVNTATQSNNPNFNLTYALKGKNPREVFKVIAGANFNTAEVDKDFFQQFLNPDSTLTGIDSTQKQVTDIKSNNFSVRLNYDKPLNKKTSLNLGVNGNHSVSHNILTTDFLKKPEMIFIKNIGLSNDLKYYQNIYAVRGAIRYDIMQDFFINGGLQAEQTTTNFDIVNSLNKYANNYWSALPFATIMKKWKNEISITVSYKRAIQRPGLNELNPSLDYSDPNNRRFGNPYLLPYFTDNFDFIIGKWNKLYFVNASLGYDALQNIYSQIRTLQPDGKTDITWQNISGRKEYQVSTWGGYTISKKSKININLGYTYNVYSQHDLDVRKFRNGGSFFSTLNSSYQFTDLLNSNASFTFNRFANPQGSVRTALSMNIGVQQKFLNKKLIISLNVIDPFRQQQNRVFTYGTNFTLENYSLTQTRNFRIAAAYIFSKTVKKKKAGKPLPKKPVKKIM
ncbi:MAG TPA: outer membrane beta-barrel protein [Chitinophagaceae bacterium]|nr:outer membrane beta-barrel protein [Chitinophagaceae bacterium]